jgi:hypothetical protein
LTSYNNPSAGATHGAELRFFSANPPKLPENLKLFTEMRQYWTSFVANLKPTAAGAVSWDVSTVTSFVIDNVTDSVFEQPVSTTAGSATAGAPRLLLDPSGRKMESSGDQAGRCKFWHDISGELQT